MILVEDRAWTRRVPELDLQCDHREVRVNLPDTYDNWLAGVYIRQSPSPGGGEASELQARVALAVGDGRLVGIISPDEATRPAIWFSIALDDLLMIEVIDRHPLTWRAPEDGLREWPGQQRSLLQALGGPTPRRKRWAVIRRLHSRR